MPNEPYSDVISGLGDCLGRVYLIRTVRLWGRVTPCQPVRIVAAWGFFDPLADDALAECNSSGPARWVVRQGNGVRSSPAGTLQLDRSPMTWLRGLTSCMTYMSYHWLPTGHLPKLTHKTWNA